MVASVLKYMKFTKVFLSSVLRLSKEILLSYNMNQDLNKFCSHRPERVKRKLPKLTQNKFNFPIKDLKLFLKDNLTSNIISI